VSNTRRTREARGGGFTRPKRLWTGHQRTTAHRQPGLQAARAQTAQTGLRYTDAIARALGRRAASGDR